MKSTAKKIRGLTYRQEVDKKESDARQSRGHPNGITNQQVQANISLMNRRTAEQAKAVSRAERSRRRAAKKALRKAVTP